MWWLLCIVYSITVDLRIFSNFSLVVSDRTTVHKQYFPISKLKPCNCALKFGKKGGRVENFNDIWPEPPSKVVRSHLRTCDTEGVEWVMPRTGVIEMTWSDRFAHDLESLPV